jgi:hypothetical protein
MARTYYVTLSREPRKGGGWDTEVSVMEGAYMWGAQLLAHQQETLTLGLWEVEGVRNKDIAVAVVMEWLAKGKPSIMTVRELKAPREEQGGS